MIRKKNKKTDTNVENWSGDVWLGGGRATSLERPLFKLFSKVGVCLFDRVLHAHPS